MLDEFKKQIRIKIQNFFEQNNINIDLSDPIERLWSIETPKFVQHGDLAFNFAPYAREYKINPADFAKRCAEAIQPNEYFVKIQAAWVYVNFFKIGRASCRERV